MVCKWSPHKLPHTDIFVGPVLAAAVVAEMLESGIEQLNGRGFKLADLLDKRDECSNDENKDERKVAIPDTEGKKGDDEEVDKKE